MEFSYLAACLENPGPAVWIETDDPAEAENYIDAVCSPRLRTLFWNAHEGFGTAFPNLGPDPVTALEVAPALVSTSGPTVLVLRNFHLPLRSPRVVAALEQALSAAARRALAIVILAPNREIPQELLPRMTMLEHNRPTPGELQSLAREFPGGVADQIDPEALAAATAGLTRSEARHALKITRDHAPAQKLAGIWAFKTWHLEQTSLLSFRRGEASLLTLLGVDHAKQFAVNVNQHGVKSRRGMLLLGPAGVGKLSLCDAAGNFARVLTVRLRWEKFLGLDPSAVERELRKALALIKALAPVHFVVPAECRGLMDLGYWNVPAASRLWGMLLEWLERGTPDVWFAATATNPNQLPGELLASDIFGGHYLMDLPSALLRGHLWDRFGNIHKLPASDSYPAAEGWSIAEIERCCRQATELGISLSESAGRIVPAAALDPASLAETRTWVAGRCLTADQGLLCRFTGRRSSSRWADPSRN